VLLLPMNNGSQGGFGLFFVAASMFLAVISVIGLMVGLTIGGYGPFLAVPSLFSTMILGAVPLVY
jgi:hypothetical protein